MNHQPPTTRNECDDVRALIPEYAFGLSDAAETRLVEATLADCPDAASDLAAFRAIQAEMRSGVAQIEPPADLRTRLMASIETREPAPKPAAIRRLPVPWLIAAAAVLVLLLTNVFWLNRVNDLSNQQSQLVAELNAQQKNAFVLTDTTNLHLVRLPASQNYANTGGNGSPAPYALMMWNTQDDRGLLCVWGLPKLQGGTTYQLWLTRGDTLVSAGTFQVDAQGKGSMVFFIRRPVDWYTWARITAEPAAGSQAPSQNVIVNGQLTT
jgi:anti-sigma-K factor RskA